MNIKLKETFKKQTNTSKSDICTLEQYDDGSIYIVGEELGELIIEFADNAYEKAVSQLDYLGYSKFPIADHARQQAG